MDWLASIFTLVSVELTARKMWQGWVVGIVSQAAYVYIAIQEELYGLIPLSLYLVVRYFLAAKEWLK